MPARIQSFQKKTENYYQNNGARHAYKPTHEYQRQKYIGQKQFSFSEQDVLSSICRDSYSFFLKEFWEIIIPEAPKWNWHIFLICKELQKLAERVFQNKPAKHDLIINLPPGMTKSTIASVAFAPWVWTRMPTARIIGNSFSHQLSMDHARRSRDLVISDKYRELFPEIQLRQDQNTKSYFMNTQGGYRYATSTGGSVTGMHGHFIISDDPIDPNATASMTEADLNAANTFMNETLPSRKVDKKIVPMVIVMQRLHQNDPSGNRLEQADISPVRHICLPAECDDFDVKPKRLKKNYVDGLLDPNRLSREFLKKELLLRGTFAYAGQYGQNPVPRHGGMFKIDKLEVVNKPPRLIRVCRYWDKAGTKGGGARTAGVLIGDAGENQIPRFFVIDVNKFQEDSATRERIIKQTAIRDGHSTIVLVEQEPGSGGLESAENTVRNLAGFTVFKDRPTGDKATRADPFSTQVNDGNVAIVRGDWNSDFLEEMKYYPNSTYKDQIDAAAGGFNYLTKSLFIVGAL